MNDSRELYRYNGMTPSLPDQVYVDFKQASGTANNPMGGIKNGSYDIDQTPRGAHPCKISIFHKNAAGQIVNTSPVSASIQDTWDVVIQTVVTEPLFLSPFIWGNPEFNSQGIMGINNMVFTINVDTTLKRMMSCGMASAAGRAYPVAISAGTTAYPAIVDQVGNVLQEAIPANPLLFQCPNFGGIQAPTQPSLLVKFLSVQPSDLLQSKNVVPYMSYPRYITSTVGGGVLNAGQSRTLTSSNLQLNQLPDLFIITVRKPMAEQKITDPNFFLKIQSVSVNLNNQSGLLSSASPEQLWRLSERNGSTQNWIEFCGVTVGNKAVFNQANNAYLYGQGVPLGTIGSVLVLDPSLDLSLPDYLSSGSMGNYNFQFSIQVYNQSGQDFTPEICVICVNSGIMVTDRGTTTTFTGILTKEMVLTAKDKKEDMTSLESKRLIGGSLHHLGSSVKKHHKRHSHTPAPKSKSKLDSFMN
jgi:hypothetical protein